MIIPVPSIEILNVYFSLFLLTSCGGIERSMWIYVLLHLHMLVCAYMCIWNQRQTQELFFNCWHNFPTIFFVFIIWKHDLPVLGNSPCSVGKTGWPPNPILHLFLFPQNQDYKHATWSAFLYRFWESNADSPVYTAISL